MIVGIVAGLLAVSLPFADGARYVDDGTAAAFLIVLLAFTSLLPAEAGRDLVAARLEIHDGGAHVGAIRTLSLDDGDLAAHDRLCGQPGCREEQGERGEDERRPRPLARVRTQSRPTG